MLEVIVDGIVGVGKTTLVRILQSELGLTPFFEISGERVEDLLRNFYSDGKRWSFTLQVYFLNKRFYQMKMAERDGRYVMDRSIYGDFLFARAQHDLGMMSDLEWEVYREMYDNLIEHVVPPRLMVYLRCSVETAVRRLKKRGRDYEQSVDLSYWEMIRNLYEDMFKSYKESMLLIVDADRIDFVEREEDRKNILRVISDLLSSHRGVYAFDGSELRRVET